jgi:hypothetical protein
MTISSVTSEALQLKLRQLLPSQQGFGTDLSASDTIIPVIDLTQAAEGSNVAVNLQTAYDSSTSHNTQTTVGPTTIINNTGFWKIDLTCTVVVQASSYFAQLDIYDGSSSNIIWRIDTVGLATNDSLQVTDDSFVVFLRAGDSLRASVSAGAAALNTWTRQIADTNGVLINPTGFNPQ